MAMPSASPTAEQVQAKMQALLNGPAGKPPPGVVSNFENPPNIDGTIIPILALCVTIATLSVLIRLYTKSFLLRSLAYEDYIIVIAWVGQIGFTVLSVFDYKSGGGTHIWDVRLKDYLRLLHWLKISGIIYGITVCLIKESILLQYLRIFVPNRKCNKVLYVAIQVLIWSIFLFYLVYLIFQVVMCSPREKMWNLLMKTGHCFDSKAAFMTTGVFNVVLDFSILVLPMIPIWKLQMPVRKKILMMAVFATGVGACVTSILRTYYNFRVLQSPDVSYNTIIMGLWTWGEITTGILISCMPIMPKFFQHLSSQVRGIFSSVSKPHSKLMHKSGSTGIKNKTGVSVLSKRPFDKYIGASGQSEIWNGLHSQQAHHKGEYITLGESDVKDIRKVEQCFILGGGPATKREDLEMGHYAI